MELREKAVMTRESAAERKAAEAAEVASSAHLVARAEVGGMNALPGTPTSCAVLAWGS